MLCHDDCLVFVAALGRTLSPVVEDWQQHSLSVFLVVFPWAMDARVSLGYGCPVFPWAMDAPRFLGLWMPRVSFGQIPLLCCHVWYGMPNNLPST